MDQTVLSGLWRMLKNAFTSLRKIVGGNTYISVSTNVTVSPQEPPLNPEPGKAEPIIVISESHHRRESNQIAVDEEGIESIDFLDFPPVPSKKRYENLTSEERDYDFARDIYTHSAEGYKRLDS